ncbi:MAG: FKBP-type peptidyl-prolyl cis-trans isomerase [Candidatus Pacebacteria bacterium]|nr:FKBP-type peptidyl-prolyl cis-trans isomerase [Candidatus Paceibacterota bacterium]
MNKSLAIGVVVVLVVLGVLAYLTLNKDGAGSSNATAKAGDVVSVNYTGRLQDGTVFDSNVDPSFGHVEPFVFPLGIGQVIPGWDEGIVGMKVGEKKTLTVPPEKGYGENAVGPIPANSTLVFEVEVLAINPQQ